MPTVFDRLSGTLQGNSVTGQVSAQSGTLVQVATKVAGLIEHPPKNIGDLGAALQALPLPKIEVGGNFAATLQSLSLAVPNDLSSVTSELTDGLDSLGGQLGELAGPLGKVLEVVVAIYQATQVDLLCLGASTPALAAGGITPLPSPLVGLSGILDQFPSPMNVTSLLTWLDQILHTLDTSQFKLVEIPIFDSLRDPLMTLTNWRHMPPPDILNSIADTLGDLQALISASADASFGAVETAAAALNNQLSTDTLRQVSDQLTAHLANLRAAIHNHDLSGTPAAVSELNTQLDSYTAVQQNVQTTLAAHLAALRDRLPTLAADLEIGLGRVSSLLTIDSPLSLLPAAPAVIPAAALGDISEYVSLISGQLQNLINRLDLSAIKDPLTTVVAGMQGAVDGLDAAQVKVTLAVQSLFAEVEKLVAQVDIAAVLANVKQGIADFQQSLVSQLQKLFQPVRDAVSQVIAEIDKGVSGFDPASIVNMLRDAIGKVADVLKAPEVASAINDIRSGIEATAKALESLSFAPLTDQVIADIHEITDSLKKIDTSQLSVPLQLALQGALAVLPADLTPFSDPLIQELQTLINEGPAPLLATIQKQPQLLIEEVRKYEPAALLGDALSAPFQKLTQQMDVFKPSKLLDPVQAELDTLKNRLRTSANPAALLQPLEALFTQLLQAFDKLSPEAVVQPLNDALHSVIAGVLDALPVDETFQQIDRVLNAIQQVAGAGDQIIALLQRILDMLNGLADPRKQVDAWMADTLANLNAITDTSSLQPELDAVSAALTKVHAAALTSRFDAAAGQLQAKLGALDPQAKLVAIIQAYNGVSKTELAALADSPEKATIITVLNRFNPVDAAFGAPYTAAAQVRTLIDQAKTGLDAAMSGWDNRFHTEGALADLQNLQASPANLQQWVGQALDAAFARPIVALLAMGEPLGQTVQPVIAELQNLVSLLDSKLAVLLTGPDSLTGVRDQMQALLDKLRGLNLNFITDSLKTLFGELRSNLDAISPAQLAGAIGQAFTAMLDSLKVSLLISAAGVAKMDSDYQAIVDQLKQLDPRKLVTDVVQPEFEETILPLLEIFDPTDALKALFDQFTHVDERLKAEMTRVNQAYQEMRDAVPSISISIDIGVDIPAGLPF